MTTGDATVDDCVLRDRLGCELVAEALRAGSEMRIRATGTSMLPAILPGDILRIRPADGKSPSLGSVVVFLRDGHLVAHRVVGRRGGQAITRGDAVPQCEPPLAPSEVLGVVSAIVLEGAAECAVRPPSLGQRIVAFAVRRSDLIYRAVLKAHRAFRNHRL